ncbi:MAG: glycerate kinase, partial [Bacteroidales bacterium]|nr:glycerate kinase [Bacteroidales bacterium]
IEIAKASGIALLKPHELNPLKANTFGTGQLIVNAIRNGCKNIIVGLGGSATSDCGIGMLTALAENFSDGTITKLPESQLLKDINFVIATDVNNPLYGENGAAHVFAPQKGATPEMVKILDSNAQKFANEMAAILGYDCSKNPGAGAAGGLGYAFMQFLGAECKSGADLLFDAADFDGKIADADLIITGEGSADSQTLMGKLPSAILRRATKFGVPVALLAGRVTDREKLIAAGFRDVVCINREGIDKAVAMQKTIAMKNIRETARKVI